jgi:hypothetical protein
VTASMFPTFMRIRYSVFTHMLLVSALSITGFTNVRTTELVTVRGVLSCSGLAGDLWTLTLDVPLDIHDPSDRQRGRTQQLKVLRFVGGRQGPKDPSSEGKHVELTGNLTAPFAGGSAGVQVKEIKLLPAEEPATTRELIELLNRKTRPESPTIRSIAAFNNWEPLPLPLDTAETLDGIRLSGCGPESHWAARHNGSKRSPPCGQTSERGVSVGEAAGVLASWVVVPQDLWFNQFSHAGPEYNRSVKLRRINGGKDFTLQIHPYGIGLVIFDDGSDAYLASRCNAAGIKPKQVQPSSRDNSPPAAQLTVDKIHFDCSCSSGKPHALPQSPDQAAQPAPHAKLLADVAQGKVVEVRVYTYASNLTFSRVRESLLQVWTAPVSDVLNGQYWDEATRYSIFATLDYANGRRGEFQSDGRHVVMQDANGRYWFVRLRQPK